MISGVAGAAGTMGTAISGAYLGLVRQTVLLGRNQAGSTDAFASGRGSNRWDSNQLEQVKFNFRLAVVFNFAGLNYGY